MFFQSIEIVVPFPQEEDANPIAAIRPFQPMVVSYDLL